MPTKTVARLQGCFAEPYSAVPHVSRLRQRWHKPQRRWADRSTALTNRSERNIRQHNYE